MLRVVVLGEARELERSVVSWRRLLERAPHAQPVLTPLWMLAWWRVFGEGRSLRALAVEEGEDLIGLLPLSLRTVSHRGAIPVRRLELLATGEDEADEIMSEYVGGVAVGGREQEVAEALADAIGDGRLGDWDELHMTAMSGDDPLVASLSAAFERRGVAAPIAQTSLAPFVPLPGTWDAYAKALGSSRRYVVTRSLRELDAWSKGRWELRRATTLRELEEGVRVLRALHAERWRAEGKSGVFASARFCAFHESVMPRLLAGEDGASLDLSWLLVRGAPIAASYSIVYRGKLHFYQSGRSVDTPKSVRPGIVLHAMGIRSAIESGLREYDFLGGMTRYKRDLSLATRPLVALRAVGPSMRARSVEAVRTLTEGAIARARTIRARFRAPTSASPGREPARERVPE
jgi:CelD/BcsL family acetyltransferase involved in cellulose biosynthesis